MISTWGWSRVSCVPLCHYLSLFKLLVTLRWLFEKLALKSGIVCISGQYWFMGCHEVLDEPKVFVIHNPLSLFCCHANSLHFLNTSKLCTTTDSMQCIKFFSVPGYTMPCLGHLCNYFGPFRKLHKCRLLSAVVKSSQSAATLNCPFNQPFPKSFDGWEIFFV